MIIKKTWILLACQLIFWALQAQKPGDVLNSWSARSPIEKVYLHLDKEEYIAGETIWYKAYLYSEYQPDTISTSLYLELSGADSKIIIRKILPVLWGTTHGQFELPDSLKSGMYFIRAYSPTMLNQSIDFLYQRSVFIYGKKETATVIPRSGNTILQFFPEGGNFIEGSLNTIAFKATDEYGMPVNVSGFVRDQKNELVNEFTSYHDGMGMFDINSTSNTRYYVQLKDDPSGKKYDFPETVKKGIVMRLMPDPQGRYYEILQKNGDENFQAAYMVGQMQHHVVFTQTLDASKDWLTGVINTSKLYSGILQITVFNKAGIPLAERLTFINNKEYILPAELVTDTLSFLPRGKNYFTIAMKDTVLGSFSISITDPAYNVNPFREANIYSGLLLTSDIKGYVHNPAWYFLPSNDSVENGVDLVMMTHGWRRFNWKELTSNPLPVQRYKDPGFITITGHINIRDTKKPLPDKELLVMISKPDSLNNSIDMMSTDAQGRFRLDSLVFFDKVRFLISDIKGKKNKWLDVFIDGDSLDRTYPMERIDTSVFVLKRKDDPGPATLQSKMAMDYDAIAKANGMLLEGITVKSKKKSPIKELEEKYASGLFSGFSEKTIDLVHSDEANHYRNIFDYLQSRVPGIWIEHEGLDYRIFYRQSSSVSSMGNLQMTLYLDEMEADASIISTIPADQVAMVKIFNTFVGSAGNGPGGVLAVYTKKGGDYSSSISSSADLFLYKGYSLIKEFYSPDYKTDPNRLQPDNRITLEWIPDLFLNSINPRIPVVFYNNDRSKSFKIIVEGITWDGRMVFLEKIINAPGQKPF